MSCGIYKIHNKISGKSYIGSSKNPEKRWYFHLHALRTGTHANIRLQSAFNKYGEANLEFSVVERCDINELLIKEVFWINKLDSTRGYNIVVPIAGIIPNYTNRKLSEEHKNKIGKSKVGKKRIPFSQEWKDKLKIAARKPRPLQSIRMKEVWSNKPAKILISLVCSDCGKIKKYTKSGASKLSGQYRCRSCYLDHHKSEKIQCY